MSGFRHLHTKYLCLLAVILAASTAAATTAQFELRLPAGTDNVLNVDNPADKVLNLELWVTLGNGPLPGNVLGYSVHLKPSAGGVVSFNTASYANAVAFDPPLVNGTDNLATTGEFGRGVNKFPAVPFSLGSTKLATFSVTAVGKGTITYSFINSPPVRPWSLDFDDFSSASVSQGTPLSIQVVPEPAVAVLMLCGMMCVARRGRR